MKKTKRGLLFLALLLALSVLLMSCGQTTTSTSSGSTTTNGPSGTTTETSKPLEPVTLILIAPGTPQKDQAIVNDAISEYLKPDLNVTVDFQQIDWATWNDKNNLVVASGEECDILFAGDWTQYPTNAVKGAFLALDDLIPQYAPDIYNASYNWLLEAARINGKIYAIPSYQILAQSRGFILRKDLVDKYGPEVNFTVKDVNEPEDLEPLLKVIKEKEPGIIPFYGVPAKLLSFMGPWDRQGETEPTAIDCYSNEAKYVNFYDNDFYRNRAETARRWFLEGLVNSDISSAVTQTNIEVFKQGKAFCYSHQTNPAEKTNIESRTGYEIVMFPLIKPIISTSLARGAMFTIPRQSENPERAVMFLNRLHTDPKLVNFFVYGLEDKHYVFEEGSDNIIKTAPGVDPTSNYINAIWMFGNQTLNFAVGKENANAAKELDEFNNSAVRSPALGFSYNPEKMKNEIAVLTNVVLEYDPAISSGSIDMYESGKYEEFLSKLKAAGIDKLLEDQNGQLQEWLKNKN